jgi:hypothetical protein
MPARTDSTGTHHRSEVLSSRSTGRHTLSEPNAVPVAELLEQAIQDGRPLWLVWPDDETSEAPATELPVLLDMPSGPPT